MIVGYQPPQRVLGLAPATANATNRLPVMVGALSGALDFARGKSMPWRTAFRITVPTTIVFKTH